MSEHGPDEYTSLGVARPSSASRARCAIARRSAGHAASATCPRRVDAGGATAPPAPAPPWRRTRRLVALGIVLVVSAVTLGSALREDNAPAVERGHAGTGAGQPARALAAAAAAEARLPRAR